MPKVLFLGCNNNQVPYLQAAQALGFQVIGTDLNPRAPGATLADRFYGVGYNDIPGLMQVAENEGLMPEDYVFTASAHFAYEGASLVAQACAIPYITPETVDICLDKAKFYKLLGEHEIPVPPTCLYDPDQPYGLDPTKEYFLKSDYGKSPSYCYRIVKGQVPALPKHFDAFYRQCFLLQESVSGVHFRVNLYAGQAAILLKINDLTALPLPEPSPDLAAIISRLRLVVSALELENWLVKFDLIANAAGWFTIDIGIDPPMRLRLLCEYLGLDFCDVYVRYYLLGDTTAIPAWAELCKPVIIKGTPQNTFNFIPLGGDS